MDLPNNAFNPKSIPRFNRWNWNNNNEQLILASDYDRLLSLYSMALEAVDGGWVSVQIEPPFVESETCGFWDWSMPHEMINSDGRHEFGALSRDRRNGSKQWTTSEGSIFKPTHYRTINDPLPTPPASSLEEKGK